MAQPFASVSLYVGDLAPEVTEAYLFDIFNAVGPVASIRVCRDSVTRRSLGYAYVNFHNAGDAERALDTMNFTNIYNRPCRIMWSHRDPSIRKSGLGNIFVKNLDRSIDNKALNDTFSMFGNILSCKVAVDEAGNSKGYGFVHYETREAAEQAIAKVNGMQIAGRRVFVMHFVPKNERSHVDPDETFTNVYINNLGSDMDDEKLRTVFQPFGEIDNCAVQTDAEGKCRGFGFVNYKEHEHAANAVNALNGTVIGNSDKPAYVGRAQKKSEREQELRNRFEAAKQERLNKYAGINLYVKNLDDTVEDEELHQEFGQFGAITSAVVMKDSNGRSRGFGFVCYTNTEEATKAVTEMNGKMWHNKPLYVALAQRRETRRQQLEADHARRIGAPGVRMPRMDAAGMAQNPPMGYPGAPPMYFQPPMAPAAVAAAGRQGFMYPPQQAAMMQRRWPSGGQPRGMVAAPYGMAPPHMNGAGPGGAAAGSSAGPRGAQGGNAAAGGRQDRRQSGGRQQSSSPNGQGAKENASGRNGQQGANNGSAMGGARGSRNSQNFKYTPQARNNRNDQQTGAQAPGGSSSPSQGGAPMMAPQGNPQTLTLSELAAAPQDQQKQILGERLFPYIQQEQPHYAGKITGMLLEMDNFELLHLLEAPDALSQRVNEAMQVLQEAEQDEAAEAADAAQEAHAAAQLQQQQQQQQESAAAVTANE